MHTPVVMAEIIGPDILIILLIGALIFGSSRIPKLARSLGQASHEFRHGLSEGYVEPTSPVPVPPPAPAPVAVKPEPPAAVEARPAANGEPTGPAAPVG